MSHSSPVIQLNDVKFFWSSDSAAIIDIERLIVNQGEHLFVKGPSGCGKSTLLSLLTGINTARSGVVSILDTQLNQLRPQQRDQFRADNIGYIFQQFNLLPYLSVIENVVLPCHFSSLRSANVSGDLAKNGEQLLTRLKLSKELINKPVAELSIGQQQRVAAARALIGAPQILIADEPTSALDFDSRSAFIELLLEEANRVNSTVVFVSHDPTLEAKFSRTISLPEINRAGGVL
jgi:putative ABC transport system ATP-binding protein